jgi:hypothetical protein
MKQNNIFHLTYNQETHGLNPSCVTYASPVLLTIQFMTTNIFLNSLARPDGDSQTLRADLGLPYLLLPLRHWVECL